jgi:hypothetical protein
MLDVMFATLHKPDPKISITDKNKARPTSIVGFSRT